MQTAAPSSKQSSPLAQTEPRIQQDDDLPVVPFDFKPVTNSNTTTGTQTYECVYEDQGKTARFRLQFKQLTKMAGDIPVASAEGKFQAVKRSDNSLLLQRLKIALDATTIPTKSSRIQELPFDAVILGSKQSRNSDGSYSAQPPGDWSTVKLFFPKGGDDGEVFLNLNTTLGKGEFSIKDSGYGDYLLAEFAKIL